MVILAINPGSTSTKLSLWRDGALIKESVPWSLPKLPLHEQIPHRLEQIHAFLEQHEQKIADIDGIGARGGLLRRLASGTYSIDDAMVEDAKQGERGVHPSNLGPILGNALAKPACIPCFVVDPVSVDERNPTAAITGFPPLKREGFGHILSLRAVARRASSEHTIPWKSSRFIGVHMGGGISVAAIIGGRILDINNANDEGPFSAERSGGLPFAAVLDLCSEPTATKEGIMSLILRESGLQGYLGTSDLRAILEREDEEARLIVRAMIYQTAKEIGAYAAVLQGQLDGIVITGGMAHAPHVIAALQEYVHRLGPLFVYPGEEELEALTEGVRRVLLGEEAAKQYGGMKDGI